MTASAANATANSTVNSTKASPKPTNPKPLYLVLGEEELLIERAVKNVLTAAKVADAAADLTSKKVSELTASTFAEMVSPSLFSEARVIVLETAQDISQELSDAVLAYLAQPVEGFSLVLVHSGGGRSKAAKGLPGAARKAGAEVLECAKITKPAEREGFVRNEIRRAGGRIDPSAVAALVEAVGSELRELASAAAQLVSDTGGTVTEQDVRRYHSGRAEVTGFVVAERAVAGERAAALESMRWAMQIGVPHVLLADALADAVRTIARVSGAGRGNPNQLASELGMPPWKVRKAQGQTRGWGPEGLAAAMQVVARLNAEVKGAAADPNYAVERAILQIVEAKVGKPTNGSA